MKNVICLDVISNTLYFNYLDKKGSVYTWHFQLNDNESIRSLYRALMNHYQKQYNAFLYVPLKHIKTLHKHGWL